MNDTESMRRCHAVGDLCPQVEQRMNVVSWRDGWALDELHHQVIRPDIVKLADIGMVQRGHCARLALKSLREFLVRHLYGDNAAQPGVPRLVNLAHASGANLRKDLVRAKFVAGRDRHISESVQFSRSEST